MRSYLGIDSGGTKTAYILAREDGHVVYLHKGSGYARMRDSTPTIVDKIARNIGYGLEHASLELADIAGIGIGLPFFGELAQKDAEIVEALAARFTGIACHIVNDCEVAWAGSLAGKPGINVVSGTGSIVFGRNEAGQTARAGGWAPFFSDEGSCYWLGRKTMELFSQQADGRVERGALYDIVRDDCALARDFDFIELMERDYIPYRDKVARLQELHERACVQGDRSALALYSECVDELARATETVARTLGFIGTPFRVSYSGGLFKSCTGQAGAQTKTTHLIVPLTARIEAMGATLATPLLDPHQGALLVAMRGCAPEVIERAIQTMLGDTPATGDDDDE